MPAVGRLGGQNRYVYPTKRLYQDTVNTTIKVQVNSLVFEFYFNFPVTPCVSALYNLVLVLILLLAVGTI